MTEGVLFSKPDNRLIWYPNGSGAQTYAIPAGTQTIGDYAFIACSSLTSVTIPDGVTSIGTWAFFGCDSLTSVTIPDSVTSIAEDAFGTYDYQSGKNVPIPTLTVTASSESYAAKYCEESGIKVTN